MSTKSYLQVFHDLAIIILYTLDLYNVMSIISQ